MPVLHYIFDPFCGWCYAATPLIEAARQVPGLQIALHGGGMLTGAHRKVISPRWRAYVLPHDRRIAELSGQPFGSAYLDGLLCDDGAVMDSAPPTTAILAAEALGGRGLDMLHRLQRAHYVEGHRIAEPAILVEQATAIGLDATAFRAAFERLSGLATETHFRDSLGWLTRAGGQGFPTLALEQADGNLARIEPGEWFGRPEDFSAALRHELCDAISDAAAPTAHCTATHCQTS